MKIKLIIFPLLLLSSLALATGDGRDNIVSIFGMEHPQSGDGRDNQDSILTQEHLSFENSIEILSSGDGRDNGGESIGSMFLYYANMGIEELALTNFKEDPEIDWEKIKVIMAKVQTKISRKKLKVLVEGKKKRVTAKSYCIDNKGNKLYCKGIPTNDINDFNFVIEIHKRKWKKLNALDDYYKKLILATHEILCLAGVESTGDYHISSTLKGSNYLEADPSWNYLY